MDKFYRRFFMQAADEKLIINELGPYLSKHQAIQLEDNIFSQKKTIFHERAQNTKL